MPMFVKVAEVAQIEEGGSCVIFFQNREVALFKVEGRVYAVDNLCPHRGGPLSAGELSGTVVTCPWHGARFDLRTGVGLPGPHSCALQAYEVKIEDGAVKLAFCA